MKFSLYVIRLVCSIVFIERGVFVLVVLRKGDIWDEGFGCGCRLFRFFFRFLGFYIFVVFIGFCILGVFFGLILEEFDIEI